VTETIEPMTAQIDQQQLTQELVERARADAWSWSARLAYSLG
jgi:hypothetical protein